MSHLRDWVYTLETDIKILSVLVSSTRLRLKILETQDRDFVEAFFWRANFVGPGVGPEQNFGPENCFAVLHMSQLEF